VKWTRYAGYVNVVAGFVVGAVEVAIGLPVVAVIVFVGLVGSGIFMIWLAAGWDKPLADPAELMRYGRPANATVMAVAEPQLTGDGGRTARVKLHVEPRNESDFKVNQVLALPGGRVPAVGERVTVKFDPQNRKTLMLLEESFEVEDSVQAARRNIAAMGS
jgi:hypothetical protein